MAVTRCVYSAFLCIGSIPLASTIIRHSMVWLPTACLEAMELYLEQMKLQAERKPLPKQESKAYTKIKVSICKVGNTLFAGATIQCPLRWKYYYV